MKTKVIQNLSFFQLFYLLVVIIYGAFVRASGSGAGCGSHWPLCNGEVVPTSPQIQTVIEFTHRVTSGLSLPLAIMILYFISTHKKDLTLAKRFSLLTVMFLVLEALLGAGLVYFEHVAQNKSSYRAVSMSLHLINTFALMACATMTAYFVNPIKTEAVKVHSKFIYPQVLMSGFVILFIGISGAITALGDTLFPVKSASEALSRGLTSTEHIFVKLRIYHPFIAILGGAFLIHTSRLVAKFGGVLRRVSQGLSLILLVQFVIGYLNVRLFAPIWLQLIHLTFAEFIWMSYIFMVVLLKSPLPKIRNVKNPSPIHV